MKKIVNKFKQTNHILVVKSFLLTTILSFIFISCDKDDDPIVPPVNEEELITTVKLTLTNSGNTVTLISKDLDADGPNQPVVTVSGPLDKNKIYTGVVELLDETKNPADVVSDEIEESDEEKLDHQFFYNLITLTGSIAYSDFDANGKPIGLNFVYTTGIESTGKLAITLRHLPNKSAEGVSLGNITNAGGSTDAEATFPITIQ